MCASQAEKLREDELAKKKNRQKEKSVRPLVVDLVSFLRDGSVAK
jgi:hypothetical protein